jgi:hypothetical protein
MLDTPDFPNKENCQSPLLIAQGCDSLQVQLLLVSPVTLCCWTKLTLSQKVSMK